MKGAVLLPGPARMAGLAPARHRESPSAAWRRVLAVCALLLEPVCLAHAALRLEDLEKIALDANPSIAQSNAGVRAAEGRRMQAGLYPNPRVGLNADEVNNGPTIRYGEWGGFFEQRIVTAGKRGLDRKIAAQDVAAAQAEARAERQRVLNRVRQLFYQALADRRLIDVRTELLAIARNAVRISTELNNVGQADKPDLFAAQVEEQRAELALTMASNARTRTWRELSSVLNRTFAPQEIEGDLDAVPQLDLDAAIAAIERESPEVELARTATSRGDLALERARREPVPDIVVRSGLRYNRELLELNRRPVGLETFLDAGVEIPLFNRNQGNIAAAKAQRERAAREPERVKLELRARLAEAAKEYADAVIALERYRTEMIPRAEQAYKMYLANFRAMSAAYPLALMTQRNLFQLREEYVMALGTAWKSVVDIRGLLVRER